MESSEKHNLSLPERNQDSESSLPSRIPSKHFKAHYSDGSCILCGTQYIEKGRVLHGHCVCEECVEYILSEDSDQS